MARTLNVRAGHDYGFFRASVAVALRVGLDALLTAGCTVALVARLSCGIYAGPHKARISRELDQDPQPSTQYRNERY